MTISVTVSLRGFGSDLDAELALDLPAGGTTADAVDLALGRALEGVIVLRNGEYVRTADAVAQCLHDGDLVVLCPLAAGG